MIDTDAKVIDNYLGYLISRSNKCSNCALKHNDNKCFFAFSCFPNYDNFIEKAFDKKDGDEE